MGRCLLPCRRQIKDVCTRVVSPLFSIHGPACESAAWCVNDAVVEVLRAVKAALWRTGWLRCFHEARCSHETECERLYECCLADWNTRCPFSFTFAYCRLFSVPLLLSNQSKKKKKKLWTRLSCSPTQGSRWRSRGQRRDRDFSESTMSPLRPARRETSVTLRTQLTGTEKQMMSGFSNTEVLWLADTFLKIPWGHFMLWIMFFFFTWMDPRIDFCSDQTTD